jgi:hypothetical protein
MPGRGLTWDNAMEEELIARYVAGLPIQEIAAEMHLTKGQVRARLTKLRGFGRVPAPRYNPGPRARRPPKAPVVPIEPLAPVEPDFRDRVRELSRLYGWRRDHA